MSEVPFYTFLLLDVGAVRAQLQSILLPSHRGTLLIRNSAHTGPYSRTLPRALWWPQGGGLFLMSEVPL